MILALPIPKAVRTWVVLRRFSNPKGNRRRDSV